MSTRRLVFVTGNANKLKESRHILLAGLEPGEKAAFELDSRDLDLPEIQGTTQEIASAKVKAAAQVIGGPCITEDTALAFTAMGGLPGPYIKFFLKELGHDGLNKMLSQFPTKAATAICTFGYCAGPDHDPIIFEGRTEGTIVPARGSNQFGWDPVFEPENSGKTFAEMTLEEKATISHRYRALDKLRTFLQGEAKDA